MMHTQTLNDARRELARRSSGGIEVTLYWRACDNRTTIEIRQEPDETLTFAVSGDRALDAFYHPFVHLPTTPVER